jgi:hypothetical protein
LAYTAAKKYSIISKMMNKHEQIIDKNVICLQSFGQQYDRKKEHL